MYVLKGEYVHVLKGEVFNIKITYPFDMKVAQSLIGAAEDLEKNAIFGRFLTKNIPK